MMFYYYLCCSQGLEVVRACSLHGRYTMMLEYHTCPPDSMRSVQSGGLELAIITVLTPQKLANTVNQGRFPLESSC